MILVLVAATFVAAAPQPGACAAPLLLDYTGLGWTDVLAQTALRRTITVCREQYRGCLVRLERVEPTAFRAVCKRSSQ